MHLEGALAQCISKWLISVNNAASLAEQDSLNKNHESMRVKIQPFG